MGDWEVDFDEVRKKCAEREMVCMVVSRFLKFPIQINLSEKDFSHSKPFCLVSDPSGVGGYMRKRRFQKLKGNWGLAHLSLHNGSVLRPLTRSLLEGLPPRNRRS